MIHEIGVAIQQRIRARGCPVVVVDGPERLASTTFGRERIVIEEIGGDTFIPPRSAHKNPKHTGDLVINAKVTIYAQSPRVGSFEFEHRRRARQILRQVWTALSEELGVRCNPLVIKGGDFVDPPDLAKSETYGGTVYAFTFAFQTGVPAETWTGDAQPEATIGGPDGVSITSRTDVRAPSVSEPTGPNDPSVPIPIPNVETSCGD